MFHSVSIQYDTDVTKERNPEMEKAQKRTPTSAEVGFLGGVRGI